MASKLPPPVIRDAPRAMAWDEYVPRVTSEWRALLASNASRDESKLQAFLERHPALVPSQFDLGAVLPRAVIAQPLLQGLTVKVPDFMWIHVNSSQIAPVMVEIETPHKRWFRRDGKPHHDFSRALDQISEWKAWIEIEGNKKIFRDFYSIPDRDWRRLTFRPHYILVHGSRLELEANPEANRKRAQQERPSETHMTFERLAPEYKAAHSLCVKIARPEKYEAVSWPPTVGISNGDANQFARIGGKEAAVRASRWLTKERREFLAGRLPHWDEWGRKPGRFEVDWERE